MNYNCKPVKSDCKTLYNSPLKATTKNDLSSKKTALRTVPRYEKEKQSRSKRFFPNTFDPKILVAVKNSQFFTKLDRRTGASILINNDDRPKNCIYMGRETVHVLCISIWIQT